MQRTYADSMDTGEYITEYYLGFDLVLRVDHAVINVFPPLFPSPGTTVQPCHIPRQKPRCHVHFRLSPQFSETKPLQSQAVLEIAVDGGKMRRFLPKGAAQEPAVSCVKSYFFCGPAQGGNAIQMLILLDLLAMRKSPA